VEQGLDIFNQVQETGGTRAGHIQPGTGYRGDKGWSYSTRYRIQGGLGLVIFNRIQVTGGQGLVIFNQVQDTGGIRAGHIQPVTGYRGGQGLDLFNQLQDTGGARPLNKKTVKLKPES
jgi:hypothetical protein